MIIYVYIHVYIYISQYTSLVKKPLIILKIDMLYVHSISNDLNSQLES